MHITLDKQTTPMQEQTSATLTYGGAGFSAVWGLLTVNQWIGIGGLIVGILGLAIKTYFEFREEKRRQERHRIHIEANTPKIETEL